MEATTPVADVDGAPSDEKALREELVQLWAQLDAEYIEGEWCDNHRDIIDFIQPQRGQFWLTDTNRGRRGDTRVINNCAWDYGRKLAAAMDTGITSEAREWFVVGTENPQDAQDHGVREYCHEFQEALYAFISKAGWYAPNRNVYLDLIGPGTGLMLIESDDKNGARCTHVPVGSYRIAVDSAGEVNTVVRRFVYSAAQMAQEFGLEKCSQAVQKAVREKKAQAAKFTVLHVIRERQSYDPEKLDAKNKPWASYWLEIGAGQVTGQSLLYQTNDPIGPSGLLRESGYDSCPFYCPRWDSVGLNAYGTDSPGWMTVGDVKALQDLELGEATLQALIMDPPMTEPDGLKDGSMTPGARIPIPSDAKVKYETAYEVPPAAVEVADKVIERYERRIARAMYSDILFLLSADQSAQKDTAEAIRGKKEERLLQLGGVFARVSRELRKALIRLASLASAKGLLPKPPQDLLQRRVAIKLDFTNPLVTAQRAVGAQALAQVVSFGLAAAQAVKGGFDNLDARKATNLYADMMGAAPDVLYSDEEMAQRDAAQAQAANAKAQAESLPQAAGAINDLSNADPDKLQATLERFTPAAGAQATAGLPS